MEKLKKKHVKELEHLFFDAASGKYLEICLTEQKDECGFNSDSSLDEKGTFYLFATKYRNFLLDVMTSFNEREFIVGTFHPYRKNFIAYSNIKEFDAYNNLHRMIHDKDTVKFEFDEEKAVIDYVLENGFRYFSDTLIYLPATNIFVHADEHCALIVYGHVEKLTLLCEFLTEKYQDTFGAYFFDYKDIF